MKNIIFIFLIFLILNSCDDKVYFDILQNEKPVFKNNDIVLFRCSDNYHIDTFLVNLTDEYNISDKKYYHERINISYHTLNRTSFFNKIFVQQSDDVTSISIDGSYFPSIYKNDNTIKIKIGDIEYSSVYHKNNYHDIPISIPKSIYYSHTQGLLKYYFSDTLFYEIVNN